MLANALLKRPAALLESAAKPALSATLMNLNRHQQPQQQEQRSGAHTDIQFPNFDAYRYDACKDTTGKGSTRTTDDRRGLPHAIFYGVGGMMAVYASKQTLQSVVQYKWMAADQAAMASVEINLEEVPEGKCKTFSWRGKPIFVKHRTEAEIKRERAVNVAELRHPEKDEDRVKKPEWSILIGVCTHLGCIPLAGSGDYNGYFCPCHGSHYDGSGRIRKGPAPLNLEVPDYEFVSDSLVRVGKS